VLTSFAVDEALQQHQLAFGMLRLYEPACNDCSTEGQGTHRESK
jgi:hypothetical protein